MKNRIYLLLALFISCSIIFASCEEETEEEDTSGTCIDGIQNRDELGVDCGGRCPACPTHCFDNIKSGDEIGIDCGGTCTPCDTVVAPCDPTDGQTSFTPFGVTGQTYNLISCSIGRGSHEDNYVIEAQASTGHITIFFADTTNPKFDAVYITAPSTGFLEPGEVRMEATTPGGYFGAKTGQEVYINVTDSNKTTVVLCDIIFGAAQGNPNQIVANGRITCP